MTEEKSNKHLVLVPLFLLLVPIIILSLVLLADTTAERVLKEDFPQKYWERKVRVMESRLEANSDERENLIKRVRRRESKAVGKKGKGDSAKTETPLVDVANLSLSGAEREILDGLNRDIKKDEAGLQKAYEAQEAVR